MPDEGNDIGSERKKCRVVLLASGAGGYSGSVSGSGGCEGRGDRGLRTSSEGDKPAGGRKRYRNRIRLVLEVLARILAAGAVVGFLVKEGHNACRRGTGTGSGRSWTTRPRTASARTGPLDAELATHGRERNQRWGITADHRAI